MGPGAVSGLRAAGGRSPRPEPVAIAAFLDSVHLGPGVLLLEGEPGIGKTTLARDAVAHAERAGFQVATSRISQSESTLSFAALGDLFSTIPDRVLEALPPPQRRALEVAMLRREADDAGLDPRAVGVACMTVLHLVAEDRPVLLVIDDVQWLDEPSAHAVAFVLRRLHHEHVGVLLTRRAGDYDPLALEQTVSSDRLRKVDVGPLPVAMLGPVLRDQLGATLPRSLVVRIHSAAAGNPFYALEIARELIRRGVPEPGEPLPLPHDTAQLLRRRLEALPQRTTAALRVAAMISRPTVVLVDAVLGDDAGSDGELDAALEVAEEAGLATIREGFVRFAHPLFASVVLATLPLADRRALHRRVARYETDPEQQARHLALADVGPVSATAAALEEAAHRARTRGAASAAAELAILALHHTPEDDETGRLRRRVLASTFAFESGDAPRSHDLLESAIESTLPGADRALVANRLCEISWQDVHRVEHFALLALENAAAAPVAAANAHHSLAWAFFYRGDFTRAAREAASGWSLVAQHPDPSLRGESCSVAALSAFPLGRPHADRLDQAVALQREAEEAEPTGNEVVYSAPRVVRGLIELWSGNLACAQRQLELELAAYEERGRYVARDELLCYLAHVTCRTGEWDVAERYVTECLEIGEESGHLLGRGQNIVPRAWLAALRGDLDGARRDAREGLDLSEQYDDLLSVATNHGVLGFAELSAGDPERALPHLRHVVDFLRRSGAVRPEMVPFVPDAVEALVATGHLDEAEAIQDDDGLTGRRYGGEAAAALAVRGGALLCAARGDLGAALGVFAGACPLRTPYPFEDARTTLVRGEIERRARHRAEARESLTSAASAFDRLGAPLWAARARTELARVSSAAPGGELTPTESQLADLVVQGKTNREAAGLMFVSVKTVEANLSRIYRKLGVRSRSELARRLSMRPNVSD